MNYKDKWKELVKLGKSRGLKVSLVPDSKTLDFVGMNDKAASSFGYEVPNKTIYVDRELNWKDRVETLKHELDERADMARGMTYWRAHKKALKSEKRLG